VASEPGWRTPLTDRIPPAWQELLDQATLTLVTRIGRALSEQSHTETLIPSPRHIFRALDTPPDRVRAIIVGQDPYPTPEHATGLAFSVPEGVWPLPPTLKNILRELGEDIGVPPPRHGNLQSWARQGVLLLNRHLTTVRSQPGAHKNVGWAEVTNRIVSTLADRDPHRVLILWGKQAESLVPLAGDMPTIVSPHPSPLSAFRGFFGSAPFSTTNHYLEKWGGEPVDWRLDAVRGCTPG
jgi:uracil-DNA glycosylase